jgi:hypothetical protein
VENIQDTIQKTFRNEDMTNKILTDFRKAKMDTWLGEGNNVMMLPV